MARIRIYKKDGTETPFFYRGGSDGTHATVFKKTRDGLKKMRGVHFDVEKNCVQRD
jgi:hypothetical protein